MKKWNISTYGAERVIEKNGVFRLVLFTTKVMIIRMSKKWLIFHIFCRVQQKLSPSLGKIFKYILKVLFSPFTKYHGLWSSELPLARCQHLKIQDFDIPLLTQDSFDIPTFNGSRTVKSKAYWQYHFLQELKDIL